MKKFFISIFLIFLVVSFVSIWNVIDGGYDKQNKTIVFLKKIIPSNVSRKISNTIFYIPNLKNRNDYLELQLAKYEQGLQGRLYKQEIVNTKKYNYNIKSFFLPFPSLDTSLGWKSKKNKLRAHYLEIIDDKILIISGEGETIYFDKKNIGNNKLNLKRLDNNLIKVINQRGNSLSAIRDIFYEENCIYVSILETKGKKSFLNIYKAKKDFNFLNFEIFFNNKEQIAGDVNLQTGGRITNYLSNNILFSVGFFGKYESVQKKESIFGKIVSINKDTKEYKLVSAGHRNPQGLLFLENKNIIINSEHGPQGGDEVNVNFLKKDIKELPNFGWPIASYGVPYPQQDKSFFEDKGYLKKSHSKNGFIEPLKSFTPSIGISEISYNKNNLYVSSLRAQSIYILELSEDFKLKDQKRIKFDSRIRDIKYDEEKDLFLIMFENIPALGVLKFI